MDDLERLRKVVGPEADAWTAAQLEQLQRDIEAMAALLLDLYRARRKRRKPKSCGSPDLDVCAPDR